MFEEIKSTIPRRISNLTENIGNFSVGSIFNQIHLCDDLWVWEL